jgi:hypothetical protein
VPEPKSHISEMICSRLRVDSASEMAPVARSVSPILQALGYRRSPYGGWISLTLPSGLTSMKPVPGAAEWIDSSRPPPSAPSTIR